MKHRLLTTLTVALIALSAWANGTEITASITCLTAKI